MSDPFEFDDPFARLCPVCGSFSCSGCLETKRKNINGNFVVIIGGVIGGFAAGLILGFFLFSRSTNETSQPMETLQPSSTVIVGTSTTTTTTISTTTTTILVVLTNDEKQMINTVNDERMKVGLTPLEWCPALARAAKDHSIDMAQRDFYDHVTPEGLEVWDRARNQGYNHSYVGENIAVGQKSVREVMIDWMNSQGHRENILEESYSHFGYGKATGLYDNEPGYIYWTQNFGAGGDCA